MALRLLVVTALIAGGGAVYNRERDRQRADPRLLDRACELTSCYPATGDLLIGRESRLFASSTCGAYNKERYCIVSHLEDRKKCFWCDSSNATSNNPNLNHKIQNIIYKYFPGTRTKSWWQSENGKENVTVQLNMEAEFHLTHLIIQFKTFRPKAMFVERSSDFGKTWRVYRYFAHNCDEAFPGVPKHTQRSLTEVVCESRYSGVAPSTEGEVIFRVIPPDINVTNPYSEEVQNLLRMTNLRINFTKLHTLGDDLLDNRAEIQEKYYYAIYEMTVRGSCSCYGHASRCLPLPGVDSKSNMVHGRCECTHNTNGLNCEYCEDFYNDLPWQPAVGKTSNACKKCTCNNHATTCHFDPAVYNKTGKISGGVCDNCQHNTMGINCERCKPKFYKDPNLDIQNSEICKPCDCDPQGTTDQEILCDDETDLANNKTAGRCLCKTNVDGPRCDRCRDGYWNFDPFSPDGCEACTCDSLGTINERGCDPSNGICFCKRHVTGGNCDQCLPEFYGLSDSDDGCSSCDCDIGGSLDRDCDVITGQCKCRPNVTGRRCDQPIQNFFVGALDSFVIEAELSQCDSEIDDNAIQSQLCNVVIRENYPDGRKKPWTGPGFMKIPEGGTLVFVVKNLKTSMNYNILVRYEPQSSINWEEATILVKRPLPIDFDSPCANVRPEDDTIYTTLPANERSVLVKPAVCLEKDRDTEIRIYLGRQDGRTSNSRATVLIDSIALIPSIDDLPFFANKSADREEFDRNNCGDPYYYNLNRENVLEICKKYHASIGFYIRNGSESCQCDPSGSKSHQCDPYTGYCQCVENIVGARCDRCAPGTYGFSKFGCKRCDCNSIGSLDNFCDATSGQCKCRANTYGRACDLCQPGYFNFPNCQQCDCNGHAVECDDKTGACRECRDYTEGHRCERCVEGYYGDPRLGIDIPCRSCPCPGVKGDPNKNSHADRCELDLETKDVVCDCQEGYAGPLCDVCADNYYGDPLKGTCEKCECNDNTDITKPGNCDPYTGNCLKCLHNTAGDSCEVCREGYYGNALDKSCYKCNCSELGTNFTKGHCDGVTGQCHCHNNVMGINCDQCTENYWRIALGTGCDPCNCDPIGSTSPQCNPYVGKCNCIPGYGGRQCDQCQENHWGDPNIECHECECDVNGAVSQQCLRDNGSCVCKPGIGGYKCDLCARGYLGEAPQCYACGECFDNWDLLIGELRTQTEYAIGNASKIKLVGATGAYTRDFEEMTNKLSEVETLLESSKQGQTTVKDLMSNVTALQNQLTEADKKVQESNYNLNAITSKINLGNVTLDSLRSGIDHLKAKTLDLSNNATKLQEANLEGALNLTREAKQRAIKAADDAENVQTLIANTDRQIKNTDRLLEMQYAHFNKTQNENDKKLSELQEQLSTLNAQFPKLNEKMCGQESDNCDICGGAGCGKCGGISCDQGAVTKAEQALDFANKTEHRIKDHELTAEDLFRSISQVKQDTVAVRSRASDLFTKANEFKSSAERVTNESQDLTTELKEFLSNTSNTPADVRALASEILNLSISVEPKEITELSERINSTVSQLTNIENIISETKPDLEKAKALNQNATAVHKSANLTLEMANKVLQALDEAQAAQDAAHNAIEKANKDIQAAKADLVPIATETELAQKKANETKKEVEGLHTRLSDLQKNVLKIESDAEQVKAEANEVVNGAELAEQKARQLRQDFKQTNMSLADRADQTSTSREKAQMLLDRATKLASHTQNQLQLLATMEELYNDNNEQLNTLEKEIADLNLQMNYYLSEITKQSVNYIWLYLEPILSNDEGELGIKFRKVDQGFRQVTRIFEADPRLSVLLQSARLQPMLDSISEQLLACQSALNKYIDEKRSTFPRLYFLSDDDLLELLGQARAGADGREAVMQTHLKKLFPGTTGVRLGPGSMSITALCSHYGETFQLDHPVDIDCPVEVWLKNLETEMRSSLKNMTLKCVVSDSLPEQDPFSLPTQILCLAQNVRFTEQTEKAINSKGLHELKANIEKESLYYAAAEAEDDSERQKRQALILQCAYYDNVVRTLIDSNVVSTSDWLWQKQLRFYILASKEVVAKMGLAQISYSYEYLGVNTGQFVRTELADECFLILTQAMDAECMGRLLSGLALCGAWGCFDEFNPATMNPVGRGYGGRRALPAALERVTRPVAMVQPRGDQLARHLLAARCVPGAAPLALDLAAVFSMARFENILSLVFADVPKEEYTTDPISSAIEASVDSLGLVHSKLQVQKCIELHEQLQQRMGVVIVGPPGSGKTTIRKLLRTAMSRNWLLGHIDHDTRQWTDGVISATALEVSSQPSDVWSWVVCDGDVDPEWVEALNSVLDDNRLLTLPSGWRIQFGANVNFLFETHDLHHASPATISRMGIILISEESSCAHEVLDNWMRKAEFDVEVVRVALPLLQQVIMKCVNWFSGHRSDVLLKLYNLSMVNSILTQFEYIAQTELSGVHKSPEELVYMAVDRGVGSAIKPNAVDAFHEEMSDVLGPPLSYPVVTNGWVTESLYILLAEYVLKESSGTLITIDCTPILEPTDIIAELKRNNVVRSGGRGSNTRFTLLVRSLHRAATDAWGTSAVHSFLLQALISEANSIFRDRLVTEEEKANFNLISKKYLKGTQIEGVFFTTKLRSDGVYMEAVDHREWYQTTQKYINQCLAESERNVFGDNGAEVCLELATLCPAFARAAVSSSSEGARTLALLRESAIDDGALACIEALRRAQSTHAIPARVMPALNNSQQTPHVLENVKRNLGIVICLDKDQENLFELMEKYPFLCKESHLIWMEGWSDETLRQMPQLIIQRLIKENVTDTSKEQHESIPIEGFVNIYSSLDIESMRAPCRYIGFIKTYFYIVSRKKETLAQRKNMLTAGVEALRRARSEVATLQADAAQQEAALSDKQAAANQALDQIGATVRATTDRKEEMHVLKKNIEVENEKLQIRKKEIEKELASVEPIIAAARSAVGDIRPESLSEIRSLRAPPDVVRDVLEGVLRLMGIADTSWHSMKNFLSKRGVKEDIRCLDASQINPEAAASVQRLLDRRGASFEPSVAKRASAACAPLAAWCAPTLRTRAHWRANLQEAEAQLSALSSGLATVDQRVAALKQQLGQHTRDAAAIELRLTNAGATIQAARTLLDQLAHEYDAWENDLEHISKEISELNIRSLLAAAYIIYLPDVTEQRALYYLEPNKCGFTPLIIDPDGDAIAWLKSTLADLSCDFVAQHSEKLQTALQYAIRLGRTLVITDVTSIHPGWLGGGCRLVLHCRDAALLERLSPPAAACLAQLRFTARRLGLTDQLVHFALQQQNPEVNEKSKEIKLKKATMQKQLYELQENLLKDLSANGDILHDANLLASLNKTRATSATIAEALAAARAIEEHTRAASEAYAPAAARAAAVALAVRGLAERKPLLALQVDTVLDLFVDALRSGRDAKEIDTETVVKYLMRRIIERVLLSLHKKDKYIVVLHLLKQVYDHLMPEPLWQILIGSYEMVEDVTIINEIKKTYPWIQNELVKKVAQLKMASEELFNRLALNDEATWKEFQSSGDLTAISKLNLSEFETVIGVALLRPDSLYRAIVTFVDHLLGARVMGGGDTVWRAARWGGGGRRARPVLLLGAHAADVLAAHAAALTQVWCISTLCLKGGKLDITNESLLEARSRAVTKLAYILRHGL
ncbi:hypothetical protein MSG28_001532 [Choristoneura fumiferana]|uniref:Uncharacterized protein n=1 Tax=Choristoneura fumiferana TaxID=7141 RepID=A0ACC0KUZ9_CHOFU|nr:hypothetical protein MSG28_001532 [Choristoneura fumiferana]